jgi:hypothetical protein
MERSRPFLFYFIEENSFYREAIEIPFYRFEAGKKNDSQMNYFILFIVNLTPNPSP